MTSKTLSAKRNVPLGIFLWGLKKNGVLMIIATVLAFLASPGFLLSGYFRFLERKTIYGYSGVFDAEPYSLAGEVLIAVGAIGLVLLFTAMNQRHLHSKKASDFWNALPISHGQLLLTRALTVLVSTAIPVTISYIGKAAVSLLMPELGLTLEVSLYGYGFILLFVFICTGMATLFAVACGNTFDMIASLLVINCGWPAVVGIFTTQASSLLTGYAAGSGFEKYFLLSPFARAVTHPFLSLPQAEAITHYTLWGLFGLLMFAAAFLLCRMRRNECSGSGYAYTALPVACQCAVGICAGFLLAVIFSLGSMFTNGGEPNLPFYLFFVIGTLLGAIIYGAIASRGFKTVLRSLLTGGIVAVVSLGAVTAMAFGGFGFETRLPAEQMIQSVCFNASYLSNYESVTITDPEEIHAVYELHKSIVEDIDNGSFSQADDSFSYIDEVASSDYDPCYSYEIEYKLSAGRTMTRRYQLSFQRYGEALGQILASKTLIDATEPVLQMADADFAGHTFTIYGNDEGGYTELTRDEAKQLIAAYRRDLEKVTPQNYHFDNDYIVEAYPTNGGVSELSNGNLMRIKSSYDETNAYLAESGILARVIASAADEGIYID